jgi:hypothetical protein
MRDDHSAGARDDITSAHYDGQARPTRYATIPTYYLQLPVYPDAKLSSIQLHLLFPTSLKYYLQLLLGTNTQPTWWVYLVSLVTTVVTVLTKLKLDPLISP